VLNIDKKMIATKPTTYPQNQKKKYWLKATKLEKTLETNKKTK
jgi:hypothetical protein